MTKKDTQLAFKVHLPNLLHEVVNCAMPKSMGILKIPLNVTRLLLIELTQRASELNDPELNAIMCNLTLYEEANPESQDYNPKMVETVMKQAKASKLKRSKNG